MEIIRVPDILVFRGGSLHSLRGQSIVNGGELHAFGSGSGVVKDGKLYVLEEEDYVVRMVTGERSVAFKIIAAESMSIEWGDGTRGQYNIGDEMLIHDYTDILASHTIRIKGTGEALTWLYCQNYSLISLDVTNGKNLKGLECYNNHLTRLDVTHNVYLEYLKCDHNQLTRLDVTHNVYLDYLRCDRNQLTAFDVSSNVELKYLACSNNNLDIVEMLSSLPDRSGKSQGIILCHQEEMASIEELCRVKNWKVMEL